MSFTSSAGGAVIIGHDIKYANTLSDETMRKLLALSPPGFAGSRPGNARKTNIPGGKWVCWGSRHSLRGDLVGVDGGLYRPFDDDLWKETAIQRARNPYVQIHEVVEERPGLFRAYDRSGDFLLDLTREGARQIGF